MTKPVTRAELREELSRLATKEEISKLVTRAELREELSHVATKEEIAKLATKEEIAKLATKEEIAKLATKEEIAKLATKEEIAKLATKEEIAKLATREEIAKLATKEELAKLATKEELAVLRADVRRDLELWGGALEARISEQLRTTFVQMTHDLRQEIARHMNAGFEESRRMFRTLDDKYADLPERVAHLEDVTGTRREPR